MFDLNVTEPFIFNTELLVKCLLIETAAVNVAQRKHCWDTKLYLNWANLSQIQYQISTHYKLHLHRVEYNIDHDEGDLKKQIVEAKQVPNPQTVASLLSHVQCFIDDAAERRPWLLSAGSQTIHNIILAKPLHWERHPQEQRVVNWWVTSHLCADLTEGD